MRWRSSDRPRHSRPCTGKSIVKWANLTASRETYVVLGFIVLWISATAWARPLALPDEGRHVGVAWEMMRSGDWLTPTLNGLPFFHKPPLFYWITAGSMSLFGLNEMAARAAPIQAQATWPFREPFAT